MKMKLIYFWIFLFSLISFPVASADDTAFEGEGQTVWPVENKEIEMAAETVMVRRGAEEWEANCIFILRNTGESTEVQIGFPDLTERSPGRETMQGTINNFKCFVDGKEIQAEHKQGVRSPLDPELTYPFAYVWRTAFGKHQTHRIVNTYSFKGIFSSNGLITLIYVLRTGSLWKGNIKNAFIEFNLGESDPRFCAEVSPSGFAFKGNTIRWRFSEFEPKEDVRVSYYTGVQNWAKKVDKSLNSDSTARLIPLLGEGLHHPETQISPELMKYFNNKIEKMIKKIEPFQDVEMYKLLLAKNRGDKKDAKKRCDKYLKTFSRKEEFTSRDEETLLHCIWISGDFLKDYSLAQEFLKIKLRLVDYKINNPEKLPYMSSELDRKRFVEEKQQILRTIEVYEQKKVKK